MLCPDYVHSIQLKNPITKNHILRRTLFLNDYERILHCKPHKNTRIIMFKKKCKELLSVNFIKLLVLAISMILYSCNLRQNRKGGIRVRVKYEILILILAIDVGEKKRTILDKFNLNSK